MPRRWANEQQRKAFFAKLDEKHGWRKPALAALAGTAVVGGAVLATRARANYLIRSALFGGMRGGTRLGKRLAHEQAVTGLSKTWRALEKDIGFMKEPLIRTLLSPSAHRLQRRLARVAGVSRKDLVGLERFSHISFKPRGIQGLHFNYSSKGLTEPGFDKLFRGGLPLDTGAGILINKTGSMRSRIGTLRHEIGHHVYSRLPIRTRIKMLRDLLATNKGWGRKYALMDSAPYVPTESFAQTYSKWRNVPLRSVSRWRRTKSMHRERHALAVALNEIRKQRATYATP